MISHSKRNLYITIIALCLVGIMGIVLFLKPKLVVIDESLPLAGSAPADSKDSAFLPRVFPIETKFDLSVFNSSKFKSLQQTTQLTVDQSELGKEDPFRPN